MSKENKKQKSGRPGKILKIILIFLAAALLICAAVIMAGWFFENTPEPSTPPDVSSTVSRPASDPDPGYAIDEDGYYTTKEDVALYIHVYGKLPPNFMTKSEAKKLGWTGGSLEKYAPGFAIGGDRFGNREGLLPDADGRIYYECDINTVGQKKRGAERIIYSNDGLIYYTGDHYESFELLYGEE